MTKSEMSATPFENREMSATPFENLFEMVRLGQATPFMADHAVQKALTAAEARGREEAAVECDEWAEANESLGNKEAAIAYRNAAFSIRNRISHNKGGE